MVRKDILDRHANQKTRRGLARPCAGDGKCRFDLCTQDRHAIELRSVTPAQRTQKLSRRGPPDRLKAAKTGMRAAVGCSVWFGVAGTIIKDHS